MCVYLLVQFIPHFLFLFSLVIFFTMQASPPLKVAFAVIFLGRVCMKDGYVIRIFTAYFSNFYYIKSEALDVPLHALKYSTYAVCYH